MDLELRKKKAWSEFGVSEIIGNILILMITVTLFSGIMAFVQQMPVPEQATKADFAAKVTFWSLGTKANLTVTHTGGDSIKAKDCIALVEVDGFNTRYNLSNPILGLKGTTTWTTGIVWAVTLSTASYSSKITVTVVDMIKKSAIWSSQVTGGTSGNAPNILQRYVDSDSQTPTADPVREWQNFSLFVTITDPDGDLDTTNGIWIDSAQLETDLPGASHRSPDDASGDVYRWDFMNILDRGLSASELDGRIIFIHARDTAVPSHESISSFTMSILQLPVDIHYQDINPQEQPPAGDSFLPTYIKWFYDNQGIGIFGERILNGTPRGIAETSTSVTSFAKDRYVFVRFASKVMANILTENKLTLIDIRTGLSVTPRFNGSSTASSPFYPMSGGGGIYLYECQFNTSPLPAGAYSLEISLKNQPSTGDPQRSYGGDKTIFITDPSSPITFYPRIFLFQDSGHTVPWGNVSSKPYQVSSSDKYKIYVAVQVQDTDSSPNVPSVAEVRITDGAKNAELYGTPPYAGAMISSIGKFDNSGQYYYNFSIDLRLNNGVQWRAGNNTYSLFISKLNDSNEGMYSLAEQVYINGAGGRADFFVGTTGMAAGNGNFNTREYAYYIQNSNLFSSRVLWKSESTPGSSTDYSVTAMAVGDIDGDGAKDLLAGVASSNRLMLFQNTLNTFGTWQAGSEISRPDLYTYRVTWIAFGDVNGDGHDDFAYSNSNNQVVIYNTTYGSAGWIFTPSGWGASTISKIDLKDMTGDGRADLIVLASGKIYVYDLKYFFDKALWADRTTVKKGTYAVSTGNSVDFDIKDVDYDGRLDIITADTAVAFSPGAIGVNVNYWTKAAGTPKVLDGGATGFIPKVDWGTYWKNRTVANTALCDGVYWRFMESNTGTESEKGRLQATMKFQQLTNNPDQQLSIVARIGALNGSSSEVFYVWFSVDGNTFIPIITIDSASWKWYNYTLPSSVANKAIYLRFTDSNSMSTSSIPTDHIDIDMAAVYTDLFGQYTGSSIPASTGWTCVRGASIDGNSGNNRMEIVVAKNSDWKVYRYGTTWTVLGNQFAPGASYPSTLSSSFYASFSSALSTKAPNYLDGVAPTLFSAVDVNGDGYTDILVTNYTTSVVSGPPSSRTENSFVGFYMNLWTGSGTYWRYFSLKSWALDVAGSAVDPWVDIVRAASLTL